MAASLRIPSPDEDLTREWLSVALGSAVESATFQRLGEADSVTGLVLRVHLEYRADARGPGSVIVKRPLRPREGRLPFAIATFTTEVRFYQRLAPALTLPVPALLAGDVDEPSGDFVLVLEDFPALRAGNNEVGATASEAARLVDQLATLHARWWNDDALRDQRYLGSLEGQVARLDAAVEERMPTFLERHGEFVAPSDREVFEAIHRRGLRALVARLFESPRTLIHGDFSMKNTLIGGTAAEPSFVVIDWQQAARQPAVRDLSFFIQTSVPPSDRASAEQALLRRYHANLESGGVTGYAFDRLLDDYRYSVLIDLARIVSFGATPNRTPAADAVVRSILGRTGSARELDLLRLVNGSAPERFQAARPFTPPG
jgi:aminoglycoside/choline kinase family phosphotransferase